MHDIPILSRRRLQAEVIQPIYDEMVKRLGEDEAQSILDTAIRQAAIAEGVQICAVAMFWIDHHILVRINNVDNV